MFKVTVPFDQDCELLEDPKDKRDSLIQKLRQRIKERDRALEVNDTHRWSSLYILYIL